MASVIKVQESFTAGDGTLLSSKTTDATYDVCSWFAFPGYEGDIEIFGNQARHYATNNGRMGVDVAMPSADYTVGLTVLPNGTDDSRIGLYLRHANSTSADKRGYLLFLSPDSRTFTVYHVNEGGSVSTIATASGSTNFSAQVAAGVGFDVWFEAVGSTLKVYINQTEIWSGTDAQLSIIGYPGFFFQDSAKATYVDNFKVIYEDSGGSGNTAPVASAGPDQSVGIGTLVQLSGSGSDADGDFLTYSWSLSRPSGSAAVLSSTSSASPSFTADVEGTYVATLTVSDGSASDSDSVSITAASASVPAPVSSLPIAEGSALVGKDSTVWDNWTDWDGWTRWNWDPAGTIVYRRTYDLGIEATVTPLVSVSAPDSGSIAIKESHSSDGQNYSAFAEIGPPVTARYVCIEVTLVDSYPYISDITVMFSAKTKDEIINDLDTTTLSGSYRLAVGDIRLPLSKSYARILKVDVAIQNVGPGWGWTLVDKDVSTGPRIKIYDGSGVLADALIDAQIYGI